MKINDEDYISITDMLKSKDGDFFVSDWLRNRNTIEFLEIWEELHNPNFNYGEFAIIKSQAGLNSYKISVKEWSLKTNAIGIFSKTVDMVVLMLTKTLHLSYVCKILKIKLIIHNQLTFVNN